MDVKVKLLWLVIVCCSCSFPKKQTADDFLFYTHEKLDSTARYPYSKMAVNLTWTGGKVADENYTIWGASPIEGEDGKIHVFCARWPEKNVFPGWKTTCEIAHYIADQAEGPYKFVETVVRGNGVEGDWMCYAPHNPEIKKIDDYYALTFIANDDPYRPAFPGNQKIGLMYSKSLYGPWKMAGKSGLIIEPSNDSTHWTYNAAKGVSNPSITEIDGKIIVYFKLCKKGTVTAHTSTFGYAIADNIEGPYKLSDGPVTDNNTYTEDATSFSYNDKHYLFTVDNKGQLSGIDVGGLLWESQDGLSFKTDRMSIAYRLLEKYYKEYDPAKANVVYGRLAKFERPKILMQDGKPSYFFAPSGWVVTGEEHVYCHVLKINGL